MKLMIFYASCVLQELQTSYIHRVSAITGYTPIARLPVYITTQYPIDIFLDSDCETRNLTAGSLILMTCNFSTLVFCQRVTTPLFLCTLFLRTHGVYGIMFKRRAPSTDTFRLFTCVDNGGVGTYSKKRGFK